MAILWFAPKAVIRIGTTLTSIGTTTSIYTQMTTDSKDHPWTGAIMDVEISGGDRDVEAFKLLGYNELLDEKRADLIVCKFSMAYQGSIRWMDSTATPQTDLDIDELLMGTKQAVGATGYKRTIGGEKASNDRVKHAVNVELTDPVTGKVVELLLNDSYCISGDFKLAADGHGEQSVTFKTLASNYRVEDNYA